MAEKRLTKSILKFAGKRGSNYLRKIRNHNLLILYSQVLDSSFMQTFSQWENLLLFFSSGLFVFMLQISDNNTNKKWSLILLSGNSIINGITHVCKWISDDALV